MASGLFNAGKVALVNGTVDWDSAALPIRVLLVTSAYTFSPDDEFVSSALAAELSGPGYTRKDLITRTATKDNTNDRAVCSAANLTWTAIDAGTAGAAIIYLRVGPDDTTPADDIMLVYSDFTPDIVTNSGDFVLTWSASGIFYF